MWGQRMQGDSNSVSDLARAFISSIKSLLLTRLYLHHGFKGLF
jgi:hypothetical protein